MKNGKTRLKCVKTHGRWSKGDEASFDSEQAKGMENAKPALWVKAEKKAEKKAETAA